MNRVLLGMNLLGACVLAMGAASCASNQAGAQDTGPEHVVISTSRGDITLELDRAKAPITVANFLWHADRGSYDGTIFHRVVENFVIQGGGWTPDLTERAKQDAANGTPDIPIRNEWRNGLKNVRGTIAMARDKNPDSATREFYINVEDNSRLDISRDVSGGAGYAVFGRVTSGLDVVDAIRKIPTAPPIPGVTDGSMQNVPVETVVITAVRRASPAGAAR